MAHLPIEYGVDLCPAPTDLPETLATLKHKFGASLLVYPLAHEPADPLHPPDDPTSDLLGDPLGSNTGLWATQIFGKMSAWLQLDSSDEKLRRKSEEAFKAQMSWAAHLGLPGVLLPPPSPSCPNYVRMVQWACASTVHMKLLVRVPIAADDEDGDAEMEGAASSRPKPPTDPWSCWDRLRTMCEQSERLRVALELGLELPVTEDEIERWGGEPIGMVLVPTSSFLPNKKGYPALTRRHQERLARLCRLRPPLVVVGRADGGPDVENPSSNPTLQEAALHQKGPPEGGLGAHVQYLQYLASKLPARDERAQFEAPYYDYLQAPLQPLADDLEAATYETFEQDPVKYREYQRAVRLCLEEKHTAGGPAVTIMVLGAGRGPLVQASINAASEAQRSVKVYALDKNMNAVVTLRNRCKNEPQWKDVTVISGDMRKWKAPVEADIIVSELLGSWGDNELSPECLDGAMRYLKPGGVSIPCSYYSTVAPLSSSKLWNEVGEARLAVPLTTPPYTSLPCPLLSFFSGARS